MGVAIESLAQRRQVPNQNDAPGGRVNRFIATVGGENVDNFLNATAPVAEASLQGAMAFTDGFNPFGDPFESNGFYDPSQLGFNKSQVIGKLTFQAELSIAITGAGAALGSSQISNWGTMSAGQKLFFTQTWTTQFAESQALGVTLTTLQLNYRAIEAYNTWSQWVSPGKPGE